MLKSSPFFALGKKIYIIGLLALSIGTASANHLTITPSSCTIPDGSSLCSLEFEWDFGALPSPNVYNVTRSVTYSTSGFETSQMYDITFGTNEIRGRSGVTTLNDTTTGDPLVLNVTGNCNGGATWDGDSCEVIPLGDISASTSTCYIAIGASTCTIPFTWTTTSVPTPNVYNNTTSVTYSTSSSGTSQSYPITNGTNNVKIRNGVSTLNSVDVTGECTLGSVWNGSNCAATLPTISGVFDTTTINAGTNYSLSWTSTNATTVTPSCTGNASASIASQSYTPVGGGTKSVATNNTMHGTTTCVLVATGAGGTATSTSFAIKINPLCSAVSNWDGSTCVNPAPSLSITPMNKTIVIGEAFDYIITANDQGSDLDFTKLQWMAPGQSQWNYENSSYGATVTPGDGYQVYGPTSSSSVTFSFTPTVAGTYTIVATVRDDTSSRWTSTTTTALVVNCPSGYIEVAYDCVNPLPSVSINPSGTNYVQLGNSINLRSTSTDSSGDITVHNITWIKPNGQDRYAVPGQEWGSVVYGGLESIPAGTATSTQLAVFTPDHVGYYTVRFATQDNALSNYNGEGPRWTYSPATTIAVVNGTTATMIQDPSNASRIRWECFNSNLATLVTTGGPTTYDFTNKTLPPAFGSFPSAPGASYTLTCRNSTTGETSTLVYAQPTITASNLGVTQTDIAYNCNNPSAQSSTLERTPGDITLYPNGTSGTRTDTGLSAGTEYIYTLRCFSAPGGTGSQVGATTVRVTTVTASPPAFTLSAYIQRVSSDPTTYSSTQPISVSTPDGQFYGWSYRVTGGVAQSCIMDQRNDNSSWYPQPGYASATSTYTFLFSSLSAQDRTAFASSFTNAHYWRLTCSDSVGRSSSLIWSLDKSGAFPTVVDATLNLNCTPPPPAPTISVQCANADYYEVRNNTTNALVTSGAGTIGTASLPNTDATYRITCKQGGSTGTANAGQYLRTYNTSMCGTTITNFTATPRTIKAGSVSTLQWTISQPTASCTLTAAPVCVGACSPTRTADAAALNTKIATENTDANDPNNINSELRTITDAIQNEAFNNGISGKAIGKKSLKVNFTTDFIMNCSTSTPGQKVRVQVSNDNQG